MCIIQPACIAAAAVLTLVLSVPFTNSSLGPEAKLYQWFYFVPSLDRVYTRAPLKVYLVLFWPM